MLKRFYCTFGCGQPLAGYVQPIIAETEDKAREEMFRRYGRKWCTSYTATEWWKAKHRGHATEKELDAIIVPEIKESQKNIERIKEII